MKETRVQQRQRRKKEIMEAACQLFCHRGIPETSMVDIAEAAGATRATVYKYFETKECILQAILEDLLNRLVLEIEQLPKITGTADEFCLELKEFIYKLFVAYKDKLKLLYGYNFIYTDENPGPPLKINHLIAGKEAFYTHGIKRQLIANGFIDADKWSSTRIHVFLESLLGIAGQLAGRGGILEDVKGISPRAYLDTMVEIFWDSVRPQRRLEKL